MSFPKASFATKRRYGERGQALVMVPALLTMLLAASALVVDMGNLYFSYSELLRATQSAAKAAGQAMANPAATSVASVADQYSGASNLGGLYNIHPNLNITAVNVNFDCVNPSSYSGLNLPPCATSANSSYPSCAVNSTYNPSGGCNVVQVKEVATVPTFFAKVFGVASLNISATASSSASGAGAIPYHIMMVLDTTASMGQGTDTGCISSETGESLSPEQCAQEGIQTLLKELAPCAANYSSCAGEPEVDEVALMTFPGLTPSQTGTLDANPPVTGPTASDDYACPASNPSITSYNNNPAYLVLPFQTNYRTSDTAGLNTSSNIVAAVGAVTDGSCDGIQTPGGEGTFYAGAITSAQNYLTYYHTSGVQDVMILLSDGDATSCGIVPSGYPGAGGLPESQYGFNCSKNQMAGSVTSYPITNECQQAVSAASTAKSNGIQIYSISYGTETTGCLYDQSPYGNSSLTPCQTMANIASTPQSKYFFSVPQTVNGKTTTVCSGAVPITQLDQVFTTIAGDLSGARLIPNAVF